MPNMDYCKFENTYHDLLECSEHFGDNDLSYTEKIYGIKLLKLCEQIANSYDKEDLE